MSDSFGVRLTQTAVDDLRAIIDHVVRYHGRHEAEDLLRLVVSAVPSLQTMPSRHRVVPELADVGIVTYREILVGPYRIVLRVDATDVFVLSVLDGRRDLGALLIERALR